MPSGDAEAGRRAWSDALAHGGMRATGELGLRSRRWPPKACRACYDGQACRAEGRGSVNWKVAPGLTLPETHRRPPPASVIARLIESPMPMPLGLVVRTR
jgi:hypothetical protein